MWVHFTGILGAKLRDTAQMAYYKITAKKWEASSVTQTSLKSAILCLLNLDDSNLDEAMQIQ